MASVTEEEPKQDQEPERSIPYARKDAAAPGFFSIVKPNQGKPTRLATGAGAALIIGATMWFFYREVPAWFISLKQANTSANAVWWNGIVLGLGAILAILAWRLINKPTSAEFLIATDSEMKKVNWTSRKELWGSTKVVIFFMFFIATVLFLIDMLFHYLFYLITVLKFAPFGM